MNPEGKIVLAIALFIGLFCLVGINAVLQPVNGNLPALGDWESIIVYSVGLLASILVIAFIWDKGKKRS